MNENVKAPKTLTPEPKSFIGLPVCTNWAELRADAVLFGVPHGKPYFEKNFPNDQSRAPFALRSASDRIVVGADSVNMDYSRSPSLSKGITLIDGGDIALEEGKLDQHYSQAENAVRYALKNNIMPISIGGDDGVTNPVLRGLDVCENITLIQIDAHLDWKDERFGEYDGYSSPMRRASELSQIKDIHQIGIRSFGSSTEQELKIAKDWGAQIHLARDIHKYGIECVIAKLPKGGQFFITLDVDGLDPSVMPGTVALAPGGLFWWHIVELFDALSQKGSILGLNVVEMSPKNDLNQISMIGVGRLILGIVLQEIVKKMK